MGSFGDPQPDAITVRMHHSLIELPDAKYKPRIYDPRAGYFMTGYRDYATPIEQPILKRFITRHRLEKKDPKAAISDPVEPIIYYLDRGAPEPIKSALLKAPAGGTRLTKQQATAMPSGWKSSPKALIPWTCATTSSTGYTALPGVGVTAVR